MKIRFFSILAIILTVCCVSFRQETRRKFNFHEYWNHYNEAQFELEVNKNYKKALVEFIWMEENGNDYFPNGYDFISQAICFSKLGDTLNATESLRKAVTHGVTDILSIGWAQDEIGIIPFKKIKDELPKLTKEYYVRNAERIPALLAEEKLTSVDQFSRKPELLKILSREDGGRVIDFADSINVAAYINNIKSGLTGAQSYMIYHLYGPFDRYVPFVDSCLMSEILSGKANPSAYASWIDRQRVEVEGKPQKFGSYTTYDYEHGSKAILEGNLLNVDSVDYYRAKIGLPPLSQDAKRIGFDLPAGYK